MTVIETDYLVVGAGASGMAFADELVASSDADVVLVDRRHRPGGHWNDAYPFVRLHQPSALYGVNSRPLGREEIVDDGPDAGFYERATAAEVCDHYHRALEEQLLPSGRVRFLGMCDHLGEHDDGHRIASRLTGEETRVRVRRRVVDATYLETSVPATHTRSFTADPDVRLVAPHELVGLVEPAGGYTVLGAGKTAMDTCSWLLDNGVPPEQIRWVRPRDAWMLDRAFFQPRALVTNLIEGLSLELEAAAEARDSDELFQRLEACGQLHRLDSAVEPTMYRGAILSETERERLRDIEDVVRLGRVRHLGVDRIVLDGGSVPTGPGQVHVDCTAVGLRSAPARPIFEPGLITLQPVRTGNTCFNAALVAQVEATRDGDAEKNRLCPTNVYMSTATDWMATTLVSTTAQARWSQDPDLGAWLERSRLNVASGVQEHLEDPRMQSALQRLLSNQEAALANLERMLAPARGGRPVAAVSG